MGRRRKANAHLPRGMLIKHGAYYLKRANKWIRLADEYGPALIKYAELVAERPAVTTIADAVSHYLETSAKRLRPATLENYQRSAKNLAAVFGHMALDALTPADVYGYLVRKGNVQANRDKALLSAAYTHARRIGAFTGDDPAKGLQYRNEESPRERYVTDAELAQILSVASPKLACIIRFSYLTGMRQADVLAVRIDDIADDGIHYRPSKAGKHAHVTIVTWTDELRQVVEDAKRLWRRFGREWLFESHPRGPHARKGKAIGPYTTSGVRALWRVAREKAGLKDVRLHDFRAKAGSDAPSESEAQDLLTHATPAVTRRHYRRKPRTVKPAR